MTPFTHTLIKWYEEHKRDLPWRDCGDPYKIWISEVILQQTRVVQGLDYYHKFIDCFPNVYRLAESKIDDVLHLWQGLGYYSRARNLHFAAQQVVELHGGKIPNNYESIRKIKGIGDYTAAAVLSFGYNLPYVAIDGNVYRVVSRYFGVEEPIDTSVCKVKIKKILSYHLPTEMAGTFNQATMEFGALQCIPKNPKCSECPLSSTCYAFGHDKVALLPWKSKTKSVKTRFFHYLYVESSQYTYVQQRQKKDIWQLLFEFPLIEEEKELTVRQLKTHAQWKEWFREEHIDDITIITTTKHQLTHQTIYAQFFRLRINTDDFLPPSTWIKANRQELDIYPMPRLLTRVKPLL